MRRLPIVLAAIGVAASVAIPACSLLTRHTRTPVTPAVDSVFTATRQVTTLAVAPDGTVWAGTAGGILRKSPDGRWTRFTRADSLPSHEVRGIRLTSDSLIAEFPTACAEWRTEKWITLDLKESPESNLPDKALCHITWRNKVYAATPSGLQVQEGATWRAIPLPQTTGTHLTALVPTDSVLLAAIYGDGIWSYDGRKWGPLGITLPKKAREITALAACSGMLYVGTRRDGIWHHDGAAWTQLLMPDEPYDHNAQAMMSYRGDLYVSTLEDGLAVKTEQGWKHVVAPTISSGAPRQMVEFQGNLYLRHGNGRVDSFDGETWSKDVFRTLPRKQVSALMADSNRLYAAQWGGWSELDSQGWTHSLTLPELQGIPITCLLPTADRLWIGTQNRGLAEYARRSGTIRWHDERMGLTDDWITSLAQFGGNVYAGTFVGGPCRFENGRWIQLPETSGLNVTALESAPNCLYAATRSGLYVIDNAGAAQGLQARIPHLDSEQQTAHRVPGGLWIGARTGLVFLTDQTLSGQR